MFQRKLLRIPRDVWISESGKLRLIKGMEENWRIDILINIAKAIGREMILDLWNY